MNRFDFLRRLQYFIFLLFIFDLLCFGAGVDIPGLDLSSRKTLFVLFFIISTLIFLGRRDERKLLNVVWLLFSIIFLVVWVLGVPSFTHGNLSYAVADALPLVASGVFLLTTDFPGRKREWIIVQRFVVLLLALFSLVHVALYIGFRIWPENQEEIVNLLARLLDVGTGEDARFVFFTPLGDGVTRVYFGASFLLLIGLYFSLSGANDCFGRGRWMRFVFASLVAGAIWVTNTRSLLLAAVAMVFLYPIFVHLLRVVSRRAFTVFVLLLLPFLCAFLLIPTVDVSFLGGIGMVRDMSDDVRSEQLSSLLDALGEHWFFGKGFGASVSFVRAENAPYAYELSILALFMKIGLGGMLFACSIWSCALGSMLSQARDVPVRKLAALYALYFSFILSCFYNPYVFGFFGTLFLLLVLYEFSFVVRGCENA